MKTTTDTLDEMISRVSDLNDYNTFAMHPKTHKELNLGNEYKGFRINTFRRMELDTVLFGVITIKEDE